MGTNEWLALQDKASCTLRPPFITDKGLIHAHCIVHPAAVRRGYSLARPESDIAQFLSDELRTPKLDAIHSWLWLAGLPVAARSLQRQCLTNRNIFLTERPDEHIVWWHDRVFLKPLPDYLLCHDFWVTNLCQDEALHHSACGLLLSYAWLVQYRCDFELAESLKLIPDGLEWKAWVEFMKSFLSYIDLDTLEQVDRRYQYGELRLSRLNLLTRMKALSIRSEGSFIYGFMSTSTWYTAFLQRNFAWLAAVFIYITVLLSTLQVGLATSALQKSRPFQTMSHGLTLASLTGSFMAAVAVFLLVGFLFWYHLMTTMLFHRKVRKSRGNKGAKNA
ncbi:hypothetical protein BCR34DRAFT_496675 [Clohesyomyces aquaticus]|uniref:Uncharacterized protein n=1 Tax=Clohesyomyces aquaticus TaxID=1231657 RepID=A0A1Y1YI73_9PLEO|nr:hypothetical protein BCR34DRAFT_496675 [Clohesyomyces aquaticus]